MSPGAFGCSARRGEPVRQLLEGAELLTDAEWLVVNVTQQQSAEDLEAELEEAESEAGIEREESEDEASAEAGSAEGEGDSSDES